MCPFRHLCTSLLMHPVAVTCGTRSSDQMIRMTEVGSYQLISAVGGRTGVVD